jgi:hypothetical protein
MKVLSLALLLVVSTAFVMLGCSDNSAPIVSPTDQTRTAVGSPTLQKTASDAATSISGVTGGEMLAAINHQLGKQGKNCRVLMMEYITAPASGQYGATVFAKDLGNKQLSAHWVPYDLLRGGNRSITYAFDGKEGTTTGGLTSPQTEGSIDNAMETWNSQSCSTIPITKVSSGGFDLGYVQYLLGFGGMPGWVADISHAGWLPGTFFDAVEDGGSQFIIAVTFTFIWVDAGVPTDIDNNRKADVAFREIYYNNAFTWSVSAPEWSDPEIDVETIALHEVGHGLSQAHFGQILNDGYGTKTPGFQLDHLHFSPRAVMNAIYWDTQRELLGSDVAGHCSIWASWPIK